MVTVLYFSAMIIGGGSTTLPSSYVFVYKITINYNRNSPLPRGFYISSPNGYGYGISYKTSTAGVDRHLI